MRTPKRYTDLIKNKKITNQIIAECIYSVNKRAKNYRDKIKDYNIFRKKIDSVYRQNDRGKE